MNWKKSLGTWSWPIRKHLPPVSGSRVFCPICENAFGRFKAFGNPKRANARCHHCQALERQRWLWLFLKERTDLLSAETKIKLLHCAPERCFVQLISNLQHVEYTAVDLEPEKYAGCGAIIERADVTNLGFPSESFDVILCNHVLEHVPEDALAMREMFRVLKPGGWGVFQVPLDSSRDLTYEDFSIPSEAERTRVFGQKDHVRWYGKDFSQRLQAAGFVVEEISPSDILTRNEIQQYAVEHGGTLPLARKLIRLGQNSSDSNPSLKPHVP